MTPLIRAPSQRPGRRPALLGLDTERGRHLVFLAHVWACAPFALIWLLAPGARGHASPTVAAQQWVVTVVAALYLGARTWIAWRDKPKLAWNYVFAIPDAAFVSVALYFSRNVESVLYFAYLLPIVEAAGTLNVGWAALIGLISVGGAVTATLGLAPISHLGAAYRLASLVVVASLMTWLARLGAELRARLEVSEDRNRIAMEMHDGVQAQLIAIAAQLDLARRLVQQDASRAATLASDCRDQARQAADDLRFLVYRLRADEPSLAFLPAVRQYVHNMSERTGIAMSVETAGAAFAIDPDTEHALFRVLQESITNVLKHSEADDVRIGVKYDGGQVVLEVRDNGRGFDASNNATAGAGLSGMKVRAASIGGVLDVSSRPGEGTTVRLTAPRERPRRALPGEAAHLGP